MSTAILIKSKNNFSEFASALIKEAYENCLVANRIGELAISLAREALNMNIKAGRMGSEGTAFSVIANEVVILMGLLEKETGDFLMTSSRFVDDLLTCLKKSRNMEHIRNSENIYNEIVKLKLSTESLDINWKNNNLILSQNEEQLVAHASSMLMEHFSLAQICKVLHNLLLNESYAVNLALVESARVKTDISIIANLDNAKKVLNEIVEASERIQKSLKRIFDYLSAATRRNK